MGVSPSLGLGGGEVLTCPSQSVLVDRNPAGPLLMSPELDVGQSQSGTGVVLINIPASGHSVRTVKWWIFSVLLSKYALFIRGSTRLGLPL